jgi:hypothetical protein
MTSVNVTSVTNTVTVVEGDTTVVTVTTAGPQGATGTVAAAASGTAAAPGISFASDPNTGIYNPSADNLSFSTGGVQRLSIASDGTVNVVGNLTEGGNNVVSVGDTGTVTSTMILDGTIVNGDINASAAIVDTKLATISTAGKVSNSATTATNANTASAIVARDGSGNFSASAITTSADATIFGVRVGRGNNAVSTNTAVGSGALNANAGGNQNTAFGVNALAACGGGILNTAVGIGAVASNNSAIGSRNVGVGAYALANGTSGQENVAIGESALLPCTGSKNTAVGFAAGSGLTTGSNNTIIGSISGTAGLSDTVIIGAGPTERLRITSAGNVGIGTSAPDNALHVNGNISFGFRDAATSRSIGYTASSGAFGANSGHISFVGNGTGTDIIYRTWEGNHIWQGNNALEMMRIDGAGQIEAGSLGTAALPVWSFLADQNTGIYSPGADQVAISTGGTGRLFIDASGRAGIGVSAPAATLDVNGSIKFVSSGIVGPIDLNVTTDTTQSYYFGLARANDINSRFNGMKVYNNANGSSGFPAGRIGFYTDRTGFQSSTERLTITEEGYVGIGTTSPLRALDVASAGNSNAFRTQVGGTTFFSVANNSNGAIVDFNDNFGALKNRIDARAGFASYFTAGNVGIGTSSPGSALEINAAASTSPFIAKINTAEAARIDSSGRLLVGTSSWYTIPDNLFGNAWSQGQQIKITDNNGAYGGLAIISASTTVNARIADISLNRQNGSTDYAVLSSGSTIGSITFNGADGSKFVRAAFIRAEVDGTPGTNDMPGRLVFSTTADGAASPTERMRIDSSGRLLVGVTSTYGGASALYPTSNGIIDLGSTVANVPAVLKLGNVGFSNTAEYATGAVEFRGFDSGGNSMGYASVEGLITDATSATRKGSIVFKTISASTVSEKMRIGSDGLVTLTGPGIKFPAAQVASADPNTLDDYEEGTWTPVLTDGTNNATMSVSNTGSYTKIGNQITVYAFVQTTSLGSVAGGIRAAGLPFQSASATYAGAAAAFGSNLAIATGQVASAYVGASNSSIAFYLWDDVAGTTPMQATEWSSDGGIVFSLSYRV